jgi:hypothetical protein
MAASEFFCENPKVQLFLPNRERFSCMTEIEWLTCEEPSAMLACLPGEVTNRKLRLFAVACCRRATALLSAEIMQALLVAELFAEGQASESERKAARAAAMAASRVDYGAGTAKGAVAHALARKATDAARFAAPPAGWLAAVSAWTAATKRPAAEMPVYGTEGWGSFALLEASERAAQCHLLRDIVGNSFRSLPHLNQECLAWRDGAIAKLALEIYEERTFDRLPNLADTLVDAGCIEGPVIQHCREPRNHFRGCWVVDLILGKE